MCVSTAAFWEDAKRSIGSGEIHSPELTAIYQRIERCPLTGGTPSKSGCVDRGWRQLVSCWTWSIGIPPHSLSISVKRSSPPWRNQTIHPETICNMPSILELCKRVAMNKNKLQKAFQLTEGKSIGSMCVPCGWNSLLNFRAERYAGAGDCGCRWVPRRIQLLSCFSAKVWKYAPGCPGYAEKIGAIFLRVIC